MHDEGVEVHGLPPSLPRRCDELLCEQFWHAGVLEDEANVVYIRTNTDWWRLTIDCGVVFWGATPRRPARYLMPELDAEARIDDLGARLELVGHTIVACEVVPISGGSEVSLRFSDGRSVSFRNVNDRTTVVPTGG